RLQKEPQNLGLHWGQFLVRNGSGAKVYACEKYPKLELTLQAEGVAYSGEIPTLIVSGPCLSSDDGHSILPFMIPLRNLHENLRNTPRYPVRMKEEGEYFTISAVHLYEDLPRYWNVVGVKLTNDSDSLLMD